MTQKRKPVRPGESINLVAKAGSYMFKHNDIATALVAKAGSYMFKHNDIATADNYALSQQNRLSIQKSSQGHHQKSNVLMQHSYASNQRTQQRRKLLFEYGGDKQKASTSGGLSIGSNPNQTPPPHVVAGSRLHRNSV